MGSKNAEDDLVKKLNEFMVSTYNQLESLPVKLPPIIHHQFNNLHDIISPYVPGLIDKLESFLGYTLTLLSITMEFIMSIDERFAHYKPSQWLLFLFLPTLLAIYFIPVLLDYFSDISRAKLMEKARQLPGIKGYVDKKLDEVRASIKKDSLQPFAGQQYQSKLDDQSKKAAVVEKKIEAYRKFDSTYLKGRVSGAIYVDDNKEYFELMRHVFHVNMWTNPLHSDIFASIRKMESEIIRMVASMYRGDPEEILGSVTSGGTESIIVACKAYRDYYLKNNSHGCNLAKGCRPEFVVPRTAHAAFEKAASILNCKITFIPVNPKTLKVDVNAMSRAINSNTCLLVGSAPQFPHGIIDSISCIARLGLENNIPVHVDACLGGFLLPFASQAGFPVDEEFDFTVPGVTSISADPHKYGFAPKGTSVVLYKERKYIHEQYSIQTDWPGGIYASPTIPGSRPGALIACCWAAMQYHGLSGYVEKTKSILRTAKKIKSAFRDDKVNGLQVMGEPFSSVIAFTSDKFNILMLNDMLKDLGWNLNILQFPPAFHICVTLLHSQTNMGTIFITDVQKCVKMLTEDGSNMKPAEGSTAAMYGMCQNISDRSIVAEVCKIHLDTQIGH